MIANHDVYTRDALLAMGMTRRTIARRLASGELIRVRRDRYVHPDAPEPLKDAVRIGGRLTCLSLLQLNGVFVFTNERVHVHALAGASRLRSANRSVPRLEPRAVRSQRLHWLPLLEPDAATGARVSFVDAVVQAVHCLPPRHAVATIDSALNLGLVSQDDLDAIFGAMPRRFWVLRGLIDGRAQSGPETLVRLILCALGCEVELQASFDRVGFVDIVVDDWLVIECDSRQFHSDWQQQVKDRNRDLVMASYGYVTMRLTAADIMYRPADVLAALRGLLRVHDGCRVG